MYAHVAEGLYLVSHKFRFDTNTQAPVNHIWIFDRSGSMWRLLPSLIRDLIGHTETLKVGDTLSVGWFSGQGQYRFILKGYEISDDYKSKQRIKNVLEQYYHTVGRTCFSEILGDTKTVVEELSPFGGPFALMFLTDGYPVVDDYDLELKRIFETLGVLSGDIESALFVGYGDFYNRDLMAGMSSAMGGTLIHSSRLLDFSNTMRGFVESVAPGQFIAFEIPEDIYKSAVIGKGFVGVGKEIDDSILVTPSTDRVAVLTRTPPESDEVPLENLLDEAYAVARVCAVKDPAVSLAVMQAVGDVEFIEGLSNAWTNEDYGKVAQGLENATENPKRRFQKGKDLSYLVPHDAYCLVNLMEELAYDDEAMFYPMHHEFNYKRIGPKAKTVEGYPAFAAGNGGCRTSDLVWNNERLNLSIRARIHGSIKLSDDAGLYGFGEEYPTSAWRNYTLVRDGNLNVTRLPVSISEETHRNLYSIGLVDKVWKKGKVFILRLDEIPIINRQIASNERPASWVCEKVWQKLEVDGILKALRSLRKEIEPEKKLESDLLSDEQIEYLEAHGITRHGFSPPVETEETDDVYHANTLKIYPKGYSSLPSLNDVRKRHKDGKMQTAAGKLVLAGYKHFLENCTHKKKENILAWLDAEIAAYKANSVELAYMLQEAKFSVLMGKQWFSDLPRGDSIMYPFEGREFVFKLGRKVIKY